MSSIRFGPPTDSISVATSKEFERQPVAKTVTSLCSPSKPFDLKSLDFELDARLAMEYAGGVEVLTKPWSVFCE